MNGFKNNTVVFPINVWIGWLPLVAANHGFDPNPDSIFTKKYGFNVQFKLIDDPVAARDAYVAGQTPILWGTLDMIALFAPGIIGVDEQAAPRVFQQIDWSSGGDGIVARSNIKSVKDLAGKQVVYAQNSPSEYYLNSMLIFAGVQPADVRHVHTKSAFEASAAFAADSSNDACVSWAPDIYTMTEGDKKISGAWRLSTTASASKVITDVYAVRADFARDHKDVVRGLVEGTFIAMQQLQDDPNFKKQACAWLGKGYDFPASDIEGMLNDAHSTNMAENKDFFLNLSSPTSFKSTWERISFVYSELGKIKGDIKYDQVMDASIITELAKGGRFAGQKDTYTTKQFSEGDWSKVNPEATPAMSSVVRIKYAKNSYHPLQHLRKIDPSTGKPELDANGNEIVLKDKLYDPDAPAAIKQIAELAAQYDSSLILIVGHVDGQPGSDTAETKKLSRQRAESLRLTLLKMYPNFPPSKFRAIGAGCSQPADANDPGNGEKNRRVEVKVYERSTE